MIQMAKLFRDENLDASVEIYFYLPSCFSVLVVSWNQRDQIISITKSTVVTAIAEARSEAHV